MYSRPAHRARPATHVSRTRKTSQPTCMPVARAAGSGQRTRAVCTRCAHGAGALCGVGVPADPAWTQLALARCVFDYRTEPFHQYTDMYVSPAPFLPTAPGDPTLQPRSAPPVAIRQPAPSCTRAESSGEHICYRGHLLRAPLPHLQRARNATI